MDKIGKKDVNIARTTRKRLAGKHPAAILLMVVCLLAAWSASAWATSASISASESNGPVSVTASASFTAYENCDNEEPPNCTTNSSGSLATYRNGAHITTVGGNGSASWSYEYDAAKWANGTYTFKAVATDSKSNTSVSESSVVIDNTPTASVSSPGQPSGPIDPSGNASFKNCITGSDGLVALEVDVTPSFSSGYNYKTCEGSCSVSYSEIINHGGPLETALLKSGDHTLNFAARSASGFSASDSAPFTVDNIPKISSGVSGELTGPVDVSATVKLNEYSKGYDGVAGLEVDKSPNLAWGVHRKECDGNCTVLYSDIYNHGGLLETATLKSGGHSLVVSAQNKAGEIATESFPFTVDNMPKISSGVSGQLSGPVDVSATITLNEYSKGYDGVAGLEVDASPALAWGVHRKECDGECTVSYSEINAHGGLLETAILSNGNHSLVVASQNRAGEVASMSFPFTVDNTPHPQVNSPGYVSGPFSISGMVSFKEYSKGAEGTVYVAIDSPNMAGNKSKTLEGASASYTFTGYNAATMTKGKHTVYARALSVNGTWSEIVHADFEVGEPDPLRENVQNKIKDAAQAPAN